MPTKLTSVISNLQALSKAVPSTPVATPANYAYIKPFLLDCSGTHREVRVVIDNMDVPGNIDVRGHVGPAPAKLTALQDTSKEKIVLAVGINYGQGCHYCKPPWITPTPLDWMDDTGMRPKINKLGTCSPCAGKGVGFPTDNDYHLIVFNIFPFITQLSWSGQELNGIEEAKLLQDYWHWATNFLDLLFFDLKPNLLIFHGANNAVPLFGMSYVSRPTFSRPSGTVAILCDNLAPSRRPILNCEIL